MREKAGSGGLDALGLAANGGGRVQIDRGPRSFPIPSRLTTADLNG